MADTAFPAGDCIEVDPLGRYVVYGHSTGEIVRLDLFGPGPGAAQAESGGAKKLESGRKAGSPRARQQDQCDVPIGWFPRFNRKSKPRRRCWRSPRIPLRDVLHQPAASGALHGYRGKAGSRSPDGRRGANLAHGPGWLAAASDRHIVLYDLRRNLQRKLDLSLVELTHLVIRPDSFGLVLVQERDRIGRVTPSARWVWKRELRSPVEDLAIGPEGFAAATTNEGELMIFDPVGEPTIGARFDPTDPPLLIEAPEGSPIGVTWVALSRRQQQLTGHDLRGKLVWNRQLPWEGWAVIKLGQFAIVSAADGRVMACDGTGKTRFQGAASGSSNDAYSIDERGEPMRISRRGVHLICTALDGRVRWRTVGDEVLGPFAAGSAGVAIMIGRSLAWFKTSELAPSAGVDLN